MVTENGPTLDDLFDFYRNTFVPAYADLVGYVGNKPAQTLIELENTLGHIAQYYNPNLETIKKEENLKKAYSHLIRNTLDCYKSLWVEMNKDLKKINDDVDARAFVLNVQEGKFDLGYQEFKRKAQIARSMELKNIGIDPLGSINLYKEAIITGKALIGYIDGNKVQKFSRVRQIIKTKEFIISNFVSFCVGLLINYVWSIISK